MAKVGDTVRFLNSIGGGRITRIEGRLAYVEENGFETPVLLNEVVVVMPAGHKPENSGAKLMFDQKAFDEGRKESKAVVENKSAADVQSVAPALEPELPVEETAHGEKLNIVMAFEPKDIKRLSTTAFNAVLVNDSNYYLSFVFLRRGSEERSWSLVYNGEVAPNELIDLASFSHDNLGDIEKITFQCVAFKKDKRFTLKSPVSVSRKLDLTKFHKLHCFRKGLYFDDPVLEIPLVRDDAAVKPLEVSVSDLNENLRPVNKEGSAAKADLRQLSDKYRIDSGRRKENKKNPADNPRKLLPLIEVDLHIGELTDSTVGMEPKDMLGLQLDTVRQTMKSHRQRIGQKIVFIHGKGDGVLRNEVLKLLKKEYPKAELQDASFQEYGFGATLVTIH